MGCATSREAPHHPDDDGDAEEVVPPAAPSSKANTTRSRRLSYSVEANAGQAHAEAIVSRASSSSRRPGQLQQQQPADGSSKVASPQSALSPARDSAKAAWGAQQQQQPGAASPRCLKAAASPASPKGGSPKGGGGSPQQHGGSSGAVRVSVACMSRAGREPGFKKTNQDNCFAFEKFITEDQALFGAMDGHGPNGHLVSGFVKKHLPMLLVNQLTAGQPLQEALSAAFMEVDADLAASAIDCEFSGCTCAVAHLTGRTLTTAWVGDSRMVVGRQARRKSGWGPVGRPAAWEAQDVSVDHKPTEPVEHARIRGSHGRVERLVDEAGRPIGPYRVWLQYAWLPGLAMSRALGDQLAHTVGVSSEPQIMSVDLTPADKVLVLASDGVWEFISSQEAVDMISDCAAPEEACRVLVDEAYQRWLAEEEGVVDDITAVVVHLTHG